jgi:hypothetical protein
MSIDENLMCSFKILKPNNKGKTLLTSNRPKTPPRKQD